MNKGVLACKAMRKIIKIVKASEKKINEAKDENGVVMVDRVKTIKAMTFEEVLAVINQFERGCLKLKELKEKGSK